MKKHNAVREAAAAGTLCVGKEDGEMNIADKGFEWREMLESLWAHNVVAK
jgi:hypothetical protein